MHRFYSYIGSKKTKYCYFAGVSLECANELDDPALVKSRLGISTFACGILFFTSVDSGRRTVTGSLGITAGATPSSTSPTSPEIR